MHKMWLGIYKALHDTVIEYIDSSSVPEQNNKPLL